MQKTLLTFLLICTALVLHGQKSISGIVKDATGEALLGANILEVGTSNGTITDLDGSFQMTVADNASIEVSFTGYTSLTVDVSGGDYYDLTLQAGTALQEVVVTALGIKREAKSLTYAQQTVGGDELTKAKDINFLNSLSGKAAGVEIQKSSGGAGGSTRVVLRGDKSLSGNSEPLFVIDGIPMANNKSSQSGMWDGVDGGDGMSALNPEDIESISVLKGSNAAALYGSQGANGVVLITTKSGKSGQTKVSVNSGVTFESRMLKPELQFRYGSVNGTKESWATSTGSYEDTYVDDFFKTGVNVINSVSISGGNDKTKAYFSYGNVKASGIIDKHTYGRNNLTFKQSTKLLDDKLTIGSNVILSSEKTLNRPRAGYYDNPLSGLYRFPRDRNFEEFKSNYSILDPNTNLEGQNWFVIDHHQSNPYWLLNKESQVHENKRVIGSLNLDYKLSDKLSVSARGNYDFADKRAEEQQSAGGNTTTVHPNGSWTYAKWNDELIYTDAILNYNDNFGDFSLGVIAGGSYQRTVFGQGVSVPGSAQFGLQYANEFFFQNIGTNVPVNSTLSSRLIKQAVFTNATIGYKEMLYVDVSGRNDWASSLAGTGNDSYFYPSVGATAILSKLIDMPEAISFAKVRFSSSRVGNEVPFNRVSPQNSVSNSGGIDPNAQEPFDNLSPEIITSTEFGANLSFFDDRFGIDYTYYNTVSTDQFIELPALAGSPFETYFVNAGKIANKGHEIVLSATPIYTRNLTWKTSFNFWQNTNTVIETHPDLKDPITTGASEGYRARFVAGGSVGDVYTFKFQRDDQDRIMLDESSGLPLRSGEDEFAGNLNPNWSLGWNNSIDFGKFGLNFIVNGKFGGLAFSQTESMLDEAGVSERSAAARDAGGFAVDAVQGGVAVSSVDPESWFKAVGGRNGIGENYLYDRTNVRLTQLSLSYQTKINDNIPVTLSLVGQNLFFLHIEAPFDPELAINTTRDSPSLDNFNLPATRTFGFNVNVNF